MSDLTYKFCCVIDREGYYTNKCVLVWFDSGEDGNSIKKIDSYNLQDGEKLIDIPPPSGFIKPQWNGTEWEETATQEEVEEAKPEPTQLVMPSIEERLSLLEALELERILGET